MRSFLLIFLFFSAAASQIFAQGLMRQTYHDPEKKNVKEVYQVKDTIKNILHGRYICVARRPLCEKCIIADLCRWPGKIVVQVDKKAS